jgi:hypothetical protein
MTAKYADLADLPEDTRIDIIGRAVTLERKNVAFVVDSTPGKVERYITKLLNKYPTIVILAQFDGPVAGSVTVKVGPG